MPVQLNVRSNLNRRETADQFGQRLSERLQHANIVGNNELIALRRYVNSKADAAQIRVVNTTKNQDLAFRVKAFGHNKAYRQERTAETLKQLLTHAGIKPAVAHQVVNDALQEDGHYRTATARMIKDILNNPAVAKALLPPPNPRRVVSPLEIKPLQAPPFSPADAMDSLFKSPLEWRLFKGLDPSVKNLQTFEHVQGGKVEYRDLSHFKVFVRIKKDRVTGEAGLYDEFNDQFPNASKKHASPRIYLLQEVKNDQAQGPHLLVPRDELISNPAFFTKEFKVLATVVPAPGEDVDLAAAKAPGAVVQKELAQYEVGATHEVDQYDTTQKLDDFLAAQGLVTGHKLGSGTYGTVKNLSPDKATESPTHAVKYFTAKDSAILKPIDLKAVRGTGNNSEGYAAYLVKSSDPLWKQPHVIAPSHYLVGSPNRKKQGTNELQLIPIDQLKSAIRSNKEKGRAELKCYGLIMEKAAGQDIFNLISKNKLSPHQRKAAARSGLQTLRAFNQRGFVHRDVKPENLMFDGTDVSFIDTGTLFKIRKTNADMPNPDGVMDPSTANELRIKQLPTSNVGTTVYMHQELRRGKRYIGTQADLHAFGLVILQMEAPLVFNAIYKEQLQPMEKNKKSHLMPYDPSLFRQRLDKVIETAQANQLFETLDEANALQANIADKSHLANLGLQCLEKADTGLPGFSAASWADRQFSDDQYVQLLSHPALRQNP